MRAKSLVSAFALLLAALALTACTSAASTPAEEDNAPHINAGGYETAVFFGGGDYLAFQDFTAEGTPTVAVRDMRAKTTRMAEGYVLLRAEPNAPVLWLEPTTIEDVVRAIGNKERYDGSRFLAGPFAHGFPHDAPPQKLAVWNLADATSEPSSIAASRWQPWAGAKSTAYLEVDPLKGSAPAAVLFMPNVGRSDGVKTELPETVETVWPLGWSPDGTQFAVESLVHETEVSRRKRRTARDLPERRLFVIDPTDASIVLESAIDSSTASPAAWTSDGKIMWVSFARSADDTSIPAIWVLDPGTGTKREIETPAQWAGRKPLPIGREAGDFVLAVAAGGTRGDEIWTMSGAEFKRLGNVRDFAYAYEAPYGVVALTYSPYTAGEGIAAWRLVSLSDLDKLPIWSGAPRPVRK